MEYIQQPQNPIMCRSNVLFWVGLGSSTNPDNLPFGMDVYIWIGDIGTTPATAEYRLIRVPSVIHVTDSKPSAIFEISGLIRSHFLSIPFNYFTPQINYEGLVVNVRVSTFLYDGTEPDPGDKIFSTTFQSQYGLLFGWDDPADVLGKVNGNAFLSDSPMNVNVGEQSRYTLSVMRSSGATAAYLKMEDDDGNFSEIALGTDYSSSELTIETYEVGPPAIGAYTLDPIRYYKAQLFTVSYQLLDERVFYLSPQCKYGQDVIGYLNRYGVWDYIFTTGGENETMKVKGNDYMSGGLDTSQTQLQTTPEGQYRIFNKNGDLETIVHTGYLNEQQNAQVREMMLSEQLFLNSQPVRLTNKNISYKTTVREKLINYDFSFKYAFTIINTQI